MDAFAEAHRHLQITRPEIRSRQLRQRWIVMGLGLAATGLYIAALFVPWWDITLFAPQYPRGLRLHIGLRGVCGDVREMDILNHYIGMAGLENAAPFERHYAPWGIGLLGFIVLAFSLLLGKRLSGLLLVPAVALPTTFLADSFYWLYRFGHHLDPHAPLRFQPFTPHLFGIGIIGQFHTEALPDVGFWLAIVSLALLLEAVWIRRRVCACCARRSTCSGYCATTLVGPGAGIRDA